jgi:hypothetical protein
VQDGPKVRRQETQVQPLSEGGVLYSMAGAVVRHNDPAPGVYVRQGVKGWEKVLVVK